MDAYSYLAVLPQELTYVRKNKHTAYCFAFRATHSTVCIPQPKCLLPYLETKKTPKALERPWLLTNI